MTRHHLVMEPQQLWEHISNMVQWNMRWDEGVWLNRWTVTVFFNTLKHPCMVNSEPMSVLTYIYILLKYSLVRYEKFTNIKQRDVRVGSQRYIPDYLNIYIFYVLWVVCVFTLHSITTEKLWQTRDLYLLQPCSAQKLWGAPNHTNWQFPHFVALGRLSIELRKISFDIS